MADLSPASAPVNFGDSFVSEPLGSSCLGEKNNTGDGVVVDEQISRISLYNNNTCTDETSAMQDELGCVTAAAGGPNCDVSLGEDSESLMDSGDNGSALQTIVTSNSGLATSGTTAPASTTAPSFVPSGALPEPVVAPEFCVNSFSSSDSANNSAMPLLTCPPSILGMRDVSYSTGASLEALALAQSTAGGLATSEFADMEAEAERLRSLAALAAIPLPSQLCGTQSLLATLPLLPHAAAAAHQLASNGTQQTEQEVVDAQFNSVGTTLAGIGPTGMEGNHQSNVALEGTVVKINGCDSEGAHATKLMDFAALLSKCSAYPLMLQMPTLDPSIALCGLDASQLKRLYTSSNAAPYDHLNVVANAEQLATLDEIRSFSLQALSAASSSNGNDLKDPGTSGGNISGNNMALKVDVADGAAVSRGIANLEGSDQQQPCVTNTTEGSNCGSSTTGHTSGVHAVSANTLTAVNFDDLLNEAAQQEQVQRLMAGLSAEELCRAAAAAQASADFGSGAQQENQDLLDIRLKAIGNYLQDLEGAAAAAGHLSGAGWMPDLFGSGTGQEALLQSTLYEWMAAAEAAGHLPAEQAALLAQTASLPAESLLGVLPDSQGEPNLQGLGMIQSGEHDLENLSICDGGQMLHSGNKRSRGRPRKQQLSDCSADSVVLPLEPTAHTSLAKRIRRNGNNNPESGFPGVSWNSRMQAWLAFFVDAEGTRRSHTFKCNKFGGVDRARVEAIDWLIRKRGEIQALTEQSRNLHGRLVEPLET